MNKQYTQLSLSTVSYFIDLDHDTDMVLSILDMGTSHIQVEGPAFEGKTIEDMLSAIDDLCTSTR